MRYSKNYYNKSKSIIFIYNFNSIQLNIQIKLKSILDKLSVNNYIIIETNNYTNILESVRSRMVSIRIPHELKELKPYDPFKKICLDILNIYDHDYEYLTEEKIEKIRVISYNLCKYSFDISEFYRELLCLFLSSAKYTNTKKTKLVSLFSKSEFNYKKSYRKIIHIEGLLIQIYYLITDNEIDR